MVSAGTGFDAIAGGCFAGVEGLGGMETASTTGSGAGVVVTMAGLAEGTVSTGAGGKALRGVGAVTVGVA